MKIFVQLRCKNLKKNHTKTNWNHLNIKLFWEITIFIVSQVGHTCYFKEKQSKNIK